MGFGVPPLVYNGLWGSSPPFIVDFGVPPISGGFWGSSLHSFGFLGSPPISVGLWCPPTPFLRGFEVPPPIPMGLWGPPPLFQRVLGVLPHSYGVLGSLPLSKSFGVPPLV